MTPLLTEVIGTFEILSFFANGTHPKTCTQCGPRHGQKKNVKLALEE